nr:DUF2339 domain-containing protein [Providencia stuartii]
MDILILVGFVVILLMVVSPILAIIAMHRVSRMRSQLSELNQRVISLEQALKPDAGSLENSQSELVHTAEMASSEKKQTPPILFQETPHYPHSLTGHSTTNASLEPHSQTGVIMSAQESQTPVDVNRFERRANNKTQLQNDSNWSLFSHFFSWVWKGNPLAKIGILLLFFGIAYLLKFGVQNNVLSPQLRLIVSSIGCLLLLGIGWYLRHKKTLFALILQGGAVGCFYITVIAAFKMYSLLPYGMAFVAMLIICAASIVLALSQRAISLAILASLGGYLAPILLSTGGGNHIFLFSYYLMLSAAILIISVWQAWRPLNLVGMFMTYFVAVLWGWEYYQTDYYVSSQIFLIANLIVFNVLTQLFALRYPHDKQLVVDNTLLFVPPFISLAIQYAISWQINVVPAFVALLLGAFYLLAGFRIHKKYAATGKELALGNMIIGASFVTLAIPLALSFEWTSIIWSIEGLLLLYYGFSVQNKKLATVGVLLILVSAITLLGGFSLYTWSRSSVYMVPVLLAACFSAGAMFHVRRETSTNFNIVSHGLLLLGLAVWYFWLPAITDILSWSGESESFIIMALVIISAWLWRILAIKADWIALLLCQSFIWLAGYYYLAVDFIQDENPMGRGEGSLIWPVMLGSSVLFAMHAQKAHYIWMQRILHGATFWLIIAFIAAQVNWFVAILPWGMNELGYFIYVMTITLTTLVLYWLQSQKMPPMKRNGIIYWYSFLPVILVLIVLSFVANLEDGKLTFWNYVPLINPLDEAGLFSIASLLLMRRGLVQKLKKIRVFDLWVIRGLSLAAIVLSILWFNGIMLRAISDFAEINWNAQALFDSRLVQTILSISWSLAALAFMIFASLKQNRLSWLFGAGIFACVVVKLFLVDIYGQDGLFRAISFIVVAILILVVGYFSPLPPKMAQEKGLNEADDETK